MTPALSPSPPRKRGPRFGFNEGCVHIDLIGEAAPIRVHGLDQLKLPGPVPFLDPLLAPNGIFHRMMMLVPDERFHRIFGSEPIEAPVPVVPHTLPQRACDASIKRSAIAARKNVDGRMLFAHVSKTICKWISVNRSGAPAFAGVTV